ncbi:hypothetical protein GJ496_006923 [Pomphorhynchus laevis]|nr:hypothetical protein GJ496_006923 [Pomphorhynchus laevis]
MVRQGYPSTSNHLYKSYSVKRQIYITSLCQITTRNCRFSGEELKRYALERSFHRTNSFVDPSQINCAKLHIITDLWTCEEEFKVVLNLECIESI